MSTDKTRLETLKSLKTMAEKFFADEPKYRSVMLSVAQYWADEADDAVHCDLTASERSLPLWPHACSESAYDDDVENVPGETCGSCGEIGYLEDWDDNGDAIAAFEAFCHEAGSQEESSASNNLPIAIARKVDNRVEVEIIGRLQRVENELEGALLGKPDPTWDDPRARELFDLVCATPAEDGPRRVLADYLMERDNPRGEYIALALEPKPSADVIKQRDALLAKHKRQWMYPLPRVMPISTARFERGFLVAGEVCAGENDLTTIKGALAWGTVERVYVHITSEPVADPAMRSLRELGPLAHGHVEPIVKAKHAWSIETLDVFVNAKEETAHLLKAKNLPKLRHLIARADDPDPAVAQMPHAPWWPQLERLTICSKDIDVVEWAGRQHELKVPWLALVEEFEEPIDASGWEVALGPKGRCEITLRGWTPHASMTRLAEIVGQLVSVATSIKLVKSEYYEPSQVDIERIGGSIPITL